MRAIVITAALVVAGCSYQPEFRAGCGPRQLRTPYGSQIEGACELVLTQRLGKHGYCSGGHTSEPQDGKGGNPNEADVSVTQGMCGVVFGGKRE
jgi:hypothetical protein